MQIFQRGPGLSRRFGVTLGLAMAGIARAAIAAETLEKRIGRIDAAAVRRGLQTAGGIGRNQSIRRQRLWKMQRLRGRTGKHREQQDCGDDSNAFRG